MDDSWWFFVGLCYTNFMANVLICLSASKYNSRVIDKGAQIAKSNHAVLSAIFVQTPKYEGISAASKSCLRENIRLNRYIGDMLIYSTLIMSI